MSYIWTLKSTDEDRIKSFEIKTFRQILRVTWMDKRTGYWRKLEQNISATVSQEKKTVLVRSCAIRKEGNCMKKKIMQGTTSGQRRRGRPRTRWQDDITKWTGLTGDRLLRPVEDRRQWREIIYEAANPPIEDGWRYKIQRRPTWWSSH